jgi:hypothetical protein
MLVDENFAINLLDLTPFKDLAVQVGIEPTTFQSQV